MSPSRARAVVGGALLLLVACDQAPTSDTRPVSVGRKDLVDAAGARGLQGATQAHASGAGDGDPAHAACRLERAELEARLAGLEAELQTLANERFERESEWLEHTRALAQIGTRIDLPATGFRSQVEDVELAADAGASAGPAAPTGTDRPEDVADSADVELREREPVAGSPEAAGTPMLGAGSTAHAPEPVVDPVARKRAIDVDPIARMRAIDIALRSLFTIEQVTGLDLLESGVLADGAIGPVVLRVLDERGRPIGSLSADRLRFECSRAARTLTLVLENGYERRGGERIPFSGRAGTTGHEPRTVSTGDEPEEIAPADTLRGGERRILLPDVDPVPWIEALPELFGEQAKDASQDDGRWDLRALRAALNELLREDAAGGYYRVQGLAGVQGVVVRDVLLYRLDRDGRIERRLFADKMSFLTEQQGLQILLEDGAQIRGEEKSAFLDGHYRIFLPSADKQRWIEAGVPGLSPAPDRAAPAGARKP